MTTKKQKLWYWRLASAVALLTIGTQVIIFNLSHQVSPTLSSYILASYYIGVSIAAYCCRIYNIQIHWNKNAIILINSKKNIKKIALRWNLVLNILFVGLTIIGVTYWKWGVSMREIGLNEILLLAFVGIAAFFYEIFALALLDRIGLEERLNNTHGMIIRTYALMGIGAAVSLWLLSMTHGSIIILMTLSFCIIMSTLFIRKHAIPEMADKLSIEPNL